MVDNMLVLNVSLVVGFFIGSLNFGEVRIVLF